MCPLSKQKWGKPYPTPSERSRGVGQDKQDNEEEGKMDSKHKTLVYTVCPILYVWMSMCSITLKDTKQILASNNCK